MARNIMETEHPKEIQEVKEAVEQRNEPRASKFEAIGIPNPQPEVEPEQFKVLFKPEYALQPENYPAGGIRGFYNHCFDRLNYQQKELPNASAKDILGWMHNNTVLGACTEYRCGKVVQRHIADQAMKNDGYLEC
ncbi:MAG: hypothetical protein IPP97_11530 [Candidatus Obscuribacter sp.]|jgi:hypothetical protein|nr:hypothetical protein [Candidatus Obscuribacter sp.]MBK7840055.1 hypothetical protein [Candidatus Obscuribacter sp.]MBK9204025.1 hypothetical protein [Candidatus Obscuribacter sp.]MBK9621313.1 hypothetical protein [Candidatus Obscuribacter sp.]MBL0186357.1 hypothetical protein [Candidatus Obscuribacter sp.]